MPDDDESILAELLRLRTENQRLRAQVGIASAGFMAIFERGDAGAEGAHCATLAEDALMQMAALESGAMSGPPD